MKRAVLSLLILAAASPCIAKYSGGSGEPNDPYQIANAADLLALVADANDYNQCFILTADIDLDPNLPGGQVFTTAVIAPGGEEAFAGLFDGAGHKIINLTINTNGAGNSYLGLFGVAGGGEIKNLGLENVSIASGDDSYHLGGLVGLNIGGNISNCYSTGIVTSNKWSDKIGGLVGLNIGGNVINCHSTSTVFCGSNSHNFGGLVGYNDSGGNISYCYSTGTVTGALSGIGGLVGLNYGNINNCFSASNVVLNYGGNYSGGLVGTHYSGNISNCYSTGNVTGATGSSQLGGLVGYIYQGNTSNCYSSGTVTNGSGGGLVGYSYQGSINSCYFLITSGQNNGLGTPLTDEQMKQQSSFIGWDFVGETANGYNDFWRLCNEGLEYPMPAWQYLPGDIVCPDGVDIFDLAVLCEQWLVEEIPADLAPPGGDGIVNFPDFAVFADQWGVSKDIYALLDFTKQWLKIGLPVCSADISPWPDGDGIVNFADFAVMAEDWLVCFVTEATSPNPADNAVNVNRNVILRWSPGKNFTSHDVYFGTDFNEVNNADNTSSGVYMGNQDVNSWDTNNFDSNSLDFNTTYYWRIDEKHSLNMTKGNIWSFTTHPEPNLDYGIAAWWKFDEGSGTIAYDSAGHNDGNLVNGPTWTTGKIGGGLSFDGVNDYVNVNYSADLDMNSAISIAAWVKLNDLNKNYFIATKQPSGLAWPNYPGNYEFRTEPSTGLLRFLHQTSSGNTFSYYDSSSGLSAGVWHHVAVTLGNGQVNFYINGAPAGTFSQSGTFGIVNNEPVRIGIRKDALIWTGMSYFNGIIDDVRIYDRDLSAEEVVLIYQQGL